MRTSIVPIILLACCGLARADDVVLSDGRTVQGQASFEGDEVVLKVRHGEARFPRKLVVRVVKKDDDPVSQLERKRKELAAGTADDRYRLGVWCRDNKFDSEAREAFQSVLVLDQDHPGARAALGFVRLDGRWVAEDDAMRRRGLVKFEGRWVSPEEMARVERERAEAARKAEADRVAREAAPVAKDPDDACVETNPFWLQGRELGCGWWSYGWAGWPCWPRRATVVRVRDISRCDRDRIIVERRREPERREHREPGERPRPSPRPEPRPQPHHAGGGVGHHR